MSGNLTPSTPRDIAHLVDERGQVSCSFLVLRGNDREIDHVGVFPGSGVSAWRMRLREAAHNHAVVLDYRMWAMPGLVPASGDWLVYERAIGAEQAPVFLKRLPTREAAEMWMLHAQ